MCSLLNTAFASITSLASGPISLAGGLGGLGAAAEKFAGGVLRREDVKGLLTGSCLQLLEILFIEHAEPVEEIVPNPVDASTSTFTSPFNESPPTLGATPSSGAPSAVTPRLASPNAFTFYLSKLHRPSDFSFILAGVFGVLQHSLSPPLLPVVGSSSGQRGKFGWATEALIVLWRALELNPKFRAYLLESEHAAGDLMVYLVTLCLEHKDDESTFPFVLSSLVRCC